MKSIENQLQNNNFPFEVLDLAEVNLFSDDVVIILGAGASVPFGLPTGLDLIDLVAKGLENEVKNLEKLRDWRYQNPLSYENSFIMKIIKSAPIYCALNKIFDASYFTNNVNNVFNCDEAINFISKEKEWLNNQVSDSIDDLIRYNDDKSELLKICIVYEILKRTHELKTEQYITRNFKARKIAQLDKNGNVKKYDNKEPIELRNWIHNFINVVRNNFINNWKSSDAWRDAKKNNKIKIISFNYDGILEEILDKNWDAVSTNLPSWKEIFEIIHPHGKTDYIPKILLNELPKYLSENASKIAVIHDKNANDELKNQRNRAKEFIEYGYQILAIGFAFAKSNCDLIGLNDKWADRGMSIHYINYDGNISLGIRAKRLDGDTLVGFLNDGKNYVDNSTNRIRANHTDNKSHIYPWEPKQGEKLEINDALMAGFLGEMPS